MTDIIKAELEGQSVSIYPDNNEYFAVFTDIQGVCAYGNSIEEVLMKLNEGYKILKQDSTLSSPLWEKSL